MSTILDTLIEAYEEMAQELEDDEKGVHSRDLSRKVEGYKNSRPYFWTRHMRRTGRLCFANIRLPEEARGQGIFTQLLEYVIANPHGFKGVEVEQVYNPRLVDYLKRRGWQDDLKKREASRRKFMRAVEELSAKYNRPIPEELSNFLDEGPNALTLWSDFTHNATGEEL